MVRFDTTRAASSGDGTFLPHGPCAIESGGYGRGKHEREVFGFLARVNLKIFLSLVFFWKSSLCL